MLANMGLRMSAPSPTVVCYEDRWTAIPGVELLARSLHRYSPNLRLDIYSPLSVLKERIADLPRATVINTIDLIGSGWNAKPTILLRALVDNERVLWLDTDIIIIGDIGTLIERRFNENALILGQEFRGKASNAGGQIRAKPHGLIPVRSLSYSVNSGSILVCRRHLKLLEGWSALLSNKQYQAAQSLPVGERSPAFVGDQDVLWGLLASRDFADVAVDYFRVGFDMIQHCGANGYHVIDRLRDMFGKRAVFVHMLGRYKPWSFNEIPSARHNTTDYLHMVCFELSPFFEAAQPYATQLNSPGWLCRRTRPAKLLNLMFGGNIALRGLPLATSSWIAASLGRRPKL